ncbi:MAG: pyridoxamine 5'-phosphate oxidase family protein [Candidatus Thorarchaeota archaeon]
MMNVVSEVPSQDQRKWIYEEIVDRIPPFRWLPPLWDVIAQLFLVEAVGILAFIYFNMPFETAILGSLTILYTVVWSGGCLYVIPWMRRLRNPTNQEERSVLKEYKSDLLWNRRNELVIGILCFIGVISYTFWDPGFLQHFLGPGYGNPLLFILLLVLAWDVSYRLGLSFMITLFAARRSIALSHAARRRRGLQYTAYSEILTLKYLDSVNIYWGATAALLLPVAGHSPLLLIGLLAYLGVIFGLSFLSFLAMEMVPWFPPDVESILHNERFAYVGLCSKGQSHVTPVIFVYDGKYIYVGISVASAKYRILKQNPKVSILVDMRDPINPMKNRAVMIRGKALILGEITLFGIVRMFIYGIWMLRVRSLFAKKYPRYMKYYDTKVQELPLAWQNKPFISRVMVRIEPQRITYWREAKPRTLRV